MKAKLPFPFNVACQKFSTRPIATSEYKLVCSLGLVLFHALEYGLRPDEEHVLSRPFEMLLDRMTSADPEANSEAELSSDDESGEEDCHDEGIEKDSGEDDPGGGDGGDGPGKTPHRAGLTLAKVLEMCASHLQNPAQADLHYKAVCRALVAEAVELSTFLQKISSGTKEFIKCHRSDPDTSDLDGLQFQDWAMLWMQVIRELRQGVKLKKVDIETHLHPVEFELTPYEMLLDDIRSQRYKLNKVMVNGDLPPRVKKDAHALILEFIRSRPPLFPASRRKLKPAPRRETSVHDRLMADIRQPQRLRPVRKRGSAGTSVETSRTNLVESTKTQQPRRRLIMADIALHLSSSFDEDDTDDAPIAPAPEQPHSLPVQLRQAPPRPTKLQWQHKHGRGDISDVPTTSLLKHKLERRHSITVCESPSRTPYRTAQDMLNHPDKVALDARQESGKENWTTTQWENSMECLSLTLEEVVHIRNVLTKAELESLLANRPLYDDVEKKRVCFTCKKTKFSFFRPWGVVCKLCERKICDKCSTKMHIPTDRFDRIPVYMLCPTATEEDSPNHSPLPKLFQFTSGSAPSSPIPGRPGGATTFNTKLNVSVYSPPHCTPPRPRVPKLRHASSMCSPRIGVPEDMADQEARRAPLLRSRTFQQKASSPQEERLRGPLMTVCRDCKGMIRQIILASRADMAKSQRKACKPPLGVVHKN
ncbi:hypothetical protein MRX96_019495 [Rhipicephalus microplus]